mgnify:FL=1
MKELGAQLQRLAPVSEALTQKANVAMVFDYQSWWALSQRNLPTTSIDYPQLAHDWYRALWKLGISVDFISPDVSPLTLAEYRAVLMPMTYLLSQSQERKFIEYVNQGGSLVASYFTGISDEHDAVKLGGYGGSLVRDCLGVMVEEFAPIRTNERVKLSNGAFGVEWSEFAKVTGAKAIATYQDGVAAGSVAVAKNGKSWYLGTRLDDASLTKIFNELVGDLNIEGAGGDRIEVIRRGDFEFQIDHRTHSWNVRNV